MKIAVVTDDGEFVSQHFGRARYYKIYSIEGNEVKAQELRERRSGHFARQASTPLHQPHEEPGGRHGFGAEAQGRHARMAAEIGDCQVLLAGGMGAGAYESFKAAGLEVILTDMANINEALSAYLAGTLRNLYGERTH